MYKNPAVLGVNSELHSLLEGFTPEDRLRDLGNNSGNMLFSESVFRVLSNSKKCSYHFTDEEIAGCDCVVIAAANWINPDDDFGFISDRLEKIDLPVIIVGLGAQLPRSNSVFSLKPGTKKLLNIAAERSKYISVRGALSESILNGIGINNVVNTGCPSLLMAGSGGLKIREFVETGKNNICVHGTRHLFLTDSAYQHNVYKYAFRNKCNLLLQSELSELYVKYRYSVPFDKFRFAIDVLCGVYEKSENELIDYIDQYANIYFDLNDWFSSARKFDFCLGTRIHGTVASLLSGTPSVLVTHDLRTSELAKSMHLPLVNASDLDFNEDFNLFDLYNKDAFSKLIFGYFDYRNKFIGFFDDVGLPFNHAYQLGNF